jgi:hypothetical protein
MDVNQRHAQAQHEVCQTSREDAPTAWRKKERGMKAKGKWGAARLKELEEMAAELLATARKLLSGQDRRNALQEIASFRVRIIGLQRQDLRSAQRKLRAKKS